MGGRKNPEPSENEKEREYYKFEKRQVGDKVVGEGGEDLDEKGAVGEVREKRRQWHEENPNRGERDPI